MEAKFWYGFLLIILASNNLVINLLVAFKDGLLALYIQFKKRKALKEYQAQIKAIPTDETSSSEELVAEDGHKENDDKGTI